MQAYVRQWFAAGLAGAVLTGFAAGASAADLKVGLDVSMSGPNASIGIPYAKGMQAGLAYISQVSGRKIQLIVLDDASDPTTAGRNARKLVSDDKVDVLMGTSGTPGALAMLQVAEESKTPMIGLLPMPANQQANPWFYTVAQPTDLMVSAVVDRMKRDGVKTVGYIGFADGWGDLVYNALVDAAKRDGLKVLDNERYARTDTSVTGQVLKILSDSPDAVMTGGGGTPGALPFIELKNQGYTGKVYGQHALINADFVRVAGSAAQGAVMSTGPIIVAEQLPDSYPTKPISMKFRQVYQQTNKDATTDAFSAYSFDAWLVFTDAAGRALKGGGEPGTGAFRIALRDAIANTHEVIGTHGVYNFKPGNIYGVDQRARVLVTLENGKWKLSQ